MGGLRMDEICNMRVKSENDNLIMLFTCYNYKFWSMYVGLIYYVCASWNQQIIILFIAKTIYSSVSLNAYW